MSICNFIWNGIYGNLLDQHSQYWTKNYHKVTFFNFCRINLRYILVVHRGIIIYCVIFSTLNVRIFSRFRLTTLDIFITKVFMHLNTCKNVREILQTKLHNLDVDFLLTNLLGVYQRIHLFIMTFLLFNEGERPVCKSQ